MKLPKIITVSCTKGGVGKSTVAINLAVELSKKYPIRVLDLDYQKSSTIFNKVRTAAGLEPLEIMGAKSIKDFNAIVKSNNDLMIIDSGAFDSDYNRAALTASDMIITPVSDSEVEIYGLLMFNKALTSIKGVKAHVLINRPAARASNIEELKSRVNAHKKTLSLLTSCLADRSDYKKVFITGQGVTEMKSRTGAAADEVKKLVKEIEKCLK